MTRYDRLIGQVVQLKRVFVLIRLCDWLFTPSHSDCEFFFIDFDIFPDRIRRTAFLMRRARSAHFTSRARELLNNPVVLSLKMISMRKYSCKTLLFTLDQLMCRREHWANFCDCVDATSRLYAALCSSILKWKIECYIFKLSLDFESNMRWCGSDIKWITQKWYLTVRYAHEMCELLPAMLRFITSFIDPAMSNCDLPTQDVHPHFWMGKVPQEPRQKIFPQNKSYVIVCLFLFETSFIHKTTPTT